MSVSSFESFFSRWRSLIAVVIIIFAGLLAYHNSFDGPFIFDDRKSIVNNPHIRQLWPIWEVFQTQAGETAAGRPVLSLSLAMNYQISGLEVWSYHAVNLAVHILAALTLFGIVRRTLLCEKLRVRFGQASFSLALICALIWMLHPLQTGSVTYIVQRAESLMGLFYLLILYCVIRGFCSNNRRRWYSLAVIACALGMGTKEIVTTVPFMVLLYDRIFVSRSFKDALTRRWGLYLGLAGTWIIFGVLAFSNPRGTTVGFSFAGLTWVEYAMTQCKIIVSSYLKLSFWPNPLVFDYGWPIVRNFGQVVPYALVLVVLLIGTAVALRYWPAWGFLGVWFFVILAPSSSFVIIITEVAAEHRMYLPLAAVVVAVVLGGYMVLARLARRQAKVVWTSAYVLAGVVVVLLGLLSFDRNKDYASVFSIWDATAKACPTNFRAHNNRGLAYSDRGQHELAIRDFELAIAINPVYTKAYNNLAWVLATQRNDQVSDRIRAVELAKKACELSSYKDPANLDTLAFAYAGIGQFDKAVETATKAMQIARAANNEKLVRHIQRNLEFYKANRSYPESK